MNIGRGAALNIRGEIRDSRQVPRVLSQAFGANTEAEVIVLPGPVPHRDGQYGIDLFYDGANGEHWVSEIRMWQPSERGWMVVLSDVRRGE